MSKRLLELGHRSPPGASVKVTSDGSVYIPVDSWIYPAMVRLYGLGFADTQFLSMRPWTRQSVLHVLERSEPEILLSNNAEAHEILDKILRELRSEETDGIARRGFVYGTYSLYGRAMGIQGDTLRDSYHLGQTIKNDYGRPYAPGFNAIAGGSGILERGRFSLYVRGEYQHAPGYQGYDQQLAAQLSQGAGPYTEGDVIPYSGFNLHQATIPAGDIPAQNPFRLVEATLSAHVLGNEISLGKSDAWLGPAQGGALAWSNNAENIYSFRINRVEPLYIPFVSSLLGPIRYDIFYGSLKGHTAPNDPWVHSTMFAFRPTSNLEFGFQRTVIFGGKGHEPVTLHTFLKSFFDVNDTTSAEKFSRNDPGARFSDFNFSYRLPYLRKYVTFYADSIAHDDVTPPSAPRRAAYRTGLYLSQVPVIRKLDFRVEAVSTDPGVSRTTGGRFNYYEGVQRQGYTNKGMIFGDWIGREAKGGQAWLAYHLSGNEWVGVEYLNKKNETDFIPGLYDPQTKRYGPGGTTQNDVSVQVVKRILQDRIEINASYQHEGFKAPVYLPGLRTNNTGTVMVTFFPGISTKEFDR